MSHKYLIFTFFALFLISCDGEDLVPPTQEEINSWREFNIELLYTTELDENLCMALDEAVDRWEAIIVDDIPDLDLSREPFDADFCRISHPILDQKVDDLLILIEVSEIDGPGGQMAVAYPCIVREVSFHPVVSVITFDIDDLDRDLTNTAIHEMGHSLGFGSFWENLGLLENPSAKNPGADTLFIGENAIQAYHAIGGIGDGVPIENNSYWPGAQDAHLREFVFGVEMMTVVESPDAYQPLSLVTIAIMKDMGYGVSYQTADSFFLPSFTPLMEVKNEL